MKLFFESLQTYENLKLELMPANYIRTRCVNPCPLVFIRVGISIQKREDSHLDKTRLAALKIWSCPISNEQDQNVKLKASLQQEDRKKLTASVLMGFVLIATLCLKPWVAFTASVPVKSCVLLSLKRIFIQRGSKKRELDALRRHYIQEKGFKVIEMWECERWRLYKTTNTVKQHIREHFPYRRSLAAQQLLEEIKKGKLFGYVQSDIEVPETLTANVANFLPILKNTLVSKNDIGDLIKNYTEEERLLSQPRKMLISSFSLQNGTLITPLLLIYLQLGLVVTKIHRFVEYTPKKCFNGFVQSAVDARRQGDENPNSSVVAETVKLLANSSYGYQIMNRSRHTVTKYLADEKTHAAIDIESKLFKKLDHVNNSLYEVELAKAQIEHKEPIIVGFFILRYAKLRTLELYYNFSSRLCDVNKFEELEMDTDSLYLALAEKELEDCIRPEMRAEWQRLRSRDCVDNFTADAVANFFPRTSCVEHKQHDKREPGLFKEEFRCREMLCLCSKTYCCYDVTSNKLKFSSKGLNERILEGNGEGPLEKYRKVLNEKVNVTSNNRGFRTNNHSVATYGQVKKGLPYFYPKRIVETSGIHNQRLNL